MTQWYLSFKGDDGFAGACIVPANTFVEAMIEAHERGCSAGGEVAYMRLPDHRPPAPDAYVGRLLSREDVERLDVDWARKLH